MHCASGYICGQLCGCISCVQSVLLLELQIKKGGGRLWCGSRGVVDVRVYLVWQCAGHLGRGMELQARLPMADPAAFPCGDDITALPWVRPLTS